MNNKKIEYFKSLIVKIGAKKDLDVNKSIISFALKSEERIDELIEFIEDNNISFNYLNDENNDWENSYINYLILTCKMFEMQDIPKEKYQSSLDIIEKYRKINL